MQTSEYNVVEVASGYAAAEIALARAYDALDDAKEAGLPLEGFMRDVRRASARSRAARARMSARGES